MTHRLLSVVTLTLVAATGAAAQGRMPDKFTNLQVLPKEITRDELSGIMRGITGSLGVRCDACHASGTNGLDYAADTKDMKKTAREMFKLVGDINSKVTAMGRTLDARTRVSCVTCHHGLSKPRTLNAELLSTYDAAGIDSTRSLFKALRTRYYGRAAYDFSDGAVGAIAEELAANPDHRADAIKLLETNLELSPKGSQTFVSMARIYAAARDTAQAITALTKGAEMDPENRMITQMLNALKNGGARRPPQH